MEKLAKARARRKKALGARMVADAISRKSKYYHRPLFVNATKTPWRVVKLGGARTLADQVAPLTLWPETECYLLTHLKTFSCRDFASPCDIVVCDRDWKVTSVRPLVPVDSVMELGQGLSNVWVFPPNATLSLKVAPGAYVSTRERGAAVER